MKKLTQYLLTVAFLAVVLLIPRHAYALGGTGIGEIGVSSTTLPVLIKSSAGTLFNIVSSSDVAGGFTVCYDSNSTTGYTAATDTDGTIANPQIAELYAVSTTSTTYGLPISLWQQSMNFANGLVCIRKIPGHSKIYFL